MLGLSLVAPAAAKTPKARAAAAQAIATPSNIRIDNFGQVNANYFRGAQPRGHDFADLAGIGVKLVIDLAKEGDPSEGANAQRAGMRFVRIPLTTDAGP